MELGDFDAPRALRRSSEETSKNPNNISSKGTSSQQVCMDIINEVECELCGVWDVTEQTYGEDYEYFCESCLSVRATTSNVDNAGENDDDTIEDSQCDENIDDENIDNDDDNDDDDNDDHEC